MKKCKLSKVGDGRFYFVCGHYDEYITTRYRFVSACRMSESEIFHRLAKYSAEDIKNYVNSVTESMGDSSYLRSFINRRNSPQKYTPLHVAIFSRNMDAVKAFVELGVRSCNSFLLCQCFFTRIHVELD